MRAFVKILLIAAGLTGLLGGALLSMGHLRSAESDLQELEMARLRNLATSWEANLLSVRSSFRDLMLRHNITAIVEHPSEWAAWRVENKVQQMQDSWPNGVARPRGWMLLRNTGEMHALVGDSTGLAAAVEEFLRPEAPDILLGSPVAGRHRFLALQYAPAGIPENPAPGRLVALLDPAALFVVPDDPPAHWTLMNSPTEAFLASSRGAEPPIGAGTWNILLSEPHGMITLDGGYPLAFCRIHVPGMSPLLVVSEIETPMSAASAAGALILLSAGTAFLVLALRPRRKESKPETAEQTAQGEPDEAKPTPDLVTFRQVFHTIQTPLLVLDANGKLLRVNAAARELFKLPKNGQPDDSLTVLGSSFQGTLREFCRKSTSPEFAEGKWLIRSTNRNVFDGEVIVSHMTSAGSELGPVTLEFRDVKSAPRTTPAESAMGAVGLDDLNPQPIILVDSQAQVLQCNRAALDISARLADKPRLNDVLPSLEETDLELLLDPLRAQRFESLFGSRMHEFYPVPTDAGIVLYGLRKSDAQSLQIALHQAQENFNTLCATVSDAVLLVDPRTHLIQEANLAASDMFGAVHPGLPGKNIDDFADWPWQSEHLRSPVQMMRADDQCIECAFEHELVKIEGEPTLMVVVSKLFELENRNARQLADYADTVAETISEQVQRMAEPSTPVMPVGPGMLVVTNPTVRDVARRMLERLGHSCEVFTNLDDATVWVVRADYRPEFLMIDLGDFDRPQDLIEIVRARCGDVPCVGLTDNESDDLPDGSNTVLNKPFELEDVVSSLQRLDLGTAVES
ncbi:MAG: PAS domain-containing protein [bacterium]|nr:PAS domain-containing protein [bacterium]